MTGFTISEGARFFIFSKKSRLAFGPTQPPIAVGTGVLSQEANGPICGFCHSPPSNAEFENEWSYTSTPAIRLHGMDGDKFTFFYLHKAICH